MVRSTLLSLVAALVLITTAATPEVPVDPHAPLPQDTGIAGLKQTLIRLRTTARLMHTTAHPDDEDGGMLVLESRGHGVTALQLTLNRGEGGQNKIGSNLLDVLGVVRTLELLAADRYYGVEQRFTRVADFGFSKTAEETFEKWQGHDVALLDMVRVIRAFRPDVLVSRFQGNERDGHGHHQASAILTREAFRAAADPNRFPEQIKEGLQPWQVKKLYIDNVRPYGQQQPPAADAYTIELDTGENDSLLGMSYVQFAMQGLKHQLSQGAGSWSVSPGRHLSYYRLIESVLPKPSPGQHEKDFLDGIDTSLPGVASRLGDESSRLPQLREQLTRMQSLVEQAAAAADRQPASAAAPLLEGMQLAERLIKEVQQSSLSPVAKDDIITILDTKREQFMAAANLALGMNLDAVVDAPPTVREGFMAVRGEAFTLTANIHKAPDVKISTVKLDVPRGWAAARVAPIGGSGGNLSARFRVTVAPDAPYTRPCVHRDSELDAVYQVENDACAVLPLPLPLVRAVATYEYQGHYGQIAAPVQVRFVQGPDLVSRRPLAVGPKFSVAVEPATRVLRAGSATTFDDHVKARSNLLTPANAAFSIRTPQRWSVDNQQHDPLFRVPGEEIATTFSIKPDGAVAEGKYTVQASVSHERESFTEGYTLITRPDIGSALYYQPAKQNLSVIDVKVPTGLKVGYIMGAGDEIPSILQQIGVDVTIITPQELASGNLGTYGTIVLGIRAYDTRDDLRVNNKRLLDFVNNGGTLVVQYNASTSDFNGANLTPYPATLSRERVSVEEAPVGILAPQDPVFSYPNQINANDFKGWVQERGLYFMSNWDPQFRPLLSSHDPGQEPANGGLVIARYGKGTYIYTGYAFFRQLPQGVPGAVRLFVNLVSAGHEGGH